MLTRPSNQITRPSYTTTQNSQIQIKHHSLTDNLRKPEFLTKIFNKVTRPRLHNSRNSSKNSNKIQTMPFNHYPNINQSQKHLKIINKSSENKKAPKFGFPNPKYPNSAITSNHNKKSEIKPQNQAIIINNRAQRTIKTYQFHRFHSDSKNPQIRILEP